MTIDRVDIRRYDIPLIRPLTIAGGTITSRTGVIISLTDHEGRTYHGEAAPLPGLHKETLDDVISELKLIQRMGKNCTPWYIEEAAETMSSSSRTALEMVLFDLLPLESSASPAHRGVRIPVSGLVMAADNDLDDEVEALLAAGCISIKVKVGRRPLAEDIRTVQRLRSRIAGRAGIRLDANRLWSLNDAAAFCRKVGPQGIEYIEEPLADRSAYAAFHSRTDMPVALDETLIDLGIEGAEQWEGAAAFVLKPSLLGGLAWTGEFIARALEKDVRPVMSCAFESDLSLRAFALFAALFHMFDTPLGLDTLKWFREPLLSEGFGISGGYVDIGAMAAIQPKLKTSLLHDV